jgi:Transposase IS116/IS110/IS902 family
LVPRQNSTGGKTRLGGITKRGNRYLRRLLINGASANLLRSKATKAEGVSFLSLDPGDMDTPLHALAVPDADPTTLRRPEDAAAEILELKDSMAFRANDRVLVEIVKSRAATAAVALSTELEFHHGPVPLAVENGAVHLAS